MLSDRVREVIDNLVDADEPLASQILFLLFDGEAYRDERNQSKTAGMLPETRSRLDEFIVALEQNLASRS